MTARFRWHRVRVGYVPAAAAGEKDKADAHAMHARLLRGPGQLGGGRRRRVCSTSVRPAAAAAGVAGARKRVLLRLGAIVAPASASVIVSSVLLAKNYDKDL